MRNVWFDEPIRGIGLHVQDLWYIVATTSLEVAWVRLRDMQSMVWTAIRADRAVGHVAGTLASRTNSIFRSRKVFFRFVTSKQLVASIGRIASRFAHRHVPARPSAATR